MDDLSGIGRSVHLSEPTSNYDGTFDVPIVIDDFTDVFSGVVQMTYDPMELEIVDVVIWDAPEARYERQYVAVDGDLHLAFAGSGGQVRVAPPSPRWW